VGLPAAAHSPRPALGCPSAKIHVDAQEIHVDALASDVMAGAGGAAGPAPDVRHQPKKYTITSLLVEQWLRQLDVMHMIVGSSPNLSNFLLFDFHVHRNVKLYMPEMYVLYTLSE
jgi:hypothetical protein